MKTTQIYFTPDLSGTIFRPRSFVFVSLILTFPMSSTGDFAVAVAQGEVFMSWRTNWTDISCYRFIINPNGSTVIRFDENNVTGIAVAKYINRVRDIGNVSLGIVSFRLLNLTVGDVGRYYYKPIVGSNDEGGQVLVIAGAPVNVSVMEVADPFENIKYTMQCLAESTSVPLGIGLTMHYQWKRDSGQNITADDRYSFSSDQSNLSINPLKRQDAGTLVCEALEHVGAVSQSSPFSLKVFYGPDDRNVSLSPSNTSYQLTELSPLAVQCSATCVPQCIYQWSGPLVSQNDTMGLLAISQISKSQNGTFICRVANPKIPGKSATAFFTLIVYYGPDANGLTLSPSNTSYQLPELSSFIVQCSASCVPQCNYQWMGPGVSQNDIRGLLSVSQISRNQNGTFACTVTNPMIPGKSATTSVFVIVYYGPDAPLTIDPVTTSYRNIEGKFIPDITCTADCNPPCNYQWTGPLGATSSRVLSLGTLDRLHWGSHFCTATNPRTAASGNGSTVHIDVIYGPDIPNLSPSTTVYTKLEGESVPDINCSAACFPGCTQVWLKGVTEVQESSGRTLPLRQVYRDKAGDYTCWFNNTESEAMGYVSIRLIVQYPPVLTMKATNTSKGGRVVINCTASGVPDKYTFFKLTHMAPDESRTIVRELEVARVSGSEVSLTIEGATYQDTGFYVCKASNGIAHYSTGQLIMDDMVSVWIADQSVITSYARYFDAEKGKTGNMHIEIYSGLFQPIVTWYLVRNGMLELLQNSSGFGMYLSAVTVGLQYYQKTVQLPGYNASLEVFDVDEEQFASYKVEINNSFAEPIFVTLELKPRGSPETPANLSIVPDSVTTHSLQLTWQAGFHGGASQTFVIEYREVGKTNWLKKSESRGLVLYVTLNTSITDLKDGTKYEFRIYSENAYNRSQVSSTVNETTKTVPSTLEGLGFGLPVAGIAGGISAGIVCIIVIGTGIFLWRRNQHKTQSEHDNDVLRKHEKRRNQINTSSAKQDGDNGKEYEGLHFTETEANQYLPLNDITLEENRNVNISLKSPESDSYQNLHPGANADIQMYSSLKIPKISKDSKKNYENTCITRPNAAAEYQNQL